MIKLIVALFVALHVLTTRIVARATALVAPLLTWVGEVAQAIFRPVIDRLNAVNDRAEDGLSHPPSPDNYRCCKGRSPGCEQVDESDEGDDQLNHGISYICTMVMWLSIETLYAAPLKEKRPLPSRS